MGRTVGDVVWGEEVWDNGLRRPGAEGEGEGDCLAPARARGPHCIRVHLPWRDDAGGRRRVHERLPGEAGSTPADPGGPTETVPLFQIYPVARSLQDL